MFAAGVEPYKVSRWMGHANLTTTDSIYAHLYEDDYSVDRDRLEAFLQTRDQLPHAPEPALSAERSRVVAP